MTTQQATPPRTTGRFGGVLALTVAGAITRGIMGALLGAGIAQFGITAFNRAIASTQPPFFIDIRLHPQVLLFIAGVAMPSSVAMRSAVRHWLSRSCTADAK